MDERKPLLYGFFFGRTPLISLSPKKTWEGFIGGMLVTLAVSPFAAAWLQQYQWLVCPSSGPLRWAGGRGLHSLPFPLNLSLPCPFPLN